MAPSLSQSTSRQDSVDYDDDYEGEEEEDTSDVMIPTDDVETRLKVAQEAQDAAASEGPNGVFCCPYCDKRYAGKHARSIWRRHLQDKHAIPLSQQPRRTRWDGDANRPKNAEERRQRMLESKRRWARKKRQAEKTGVKVSAEDSFGEASPSEANFKDSSQKPASVQQAATTKKRAPKPKVPQQIKFHNITQSEMPPFVDFGSGSVTGGGGMLWPTTSDSTFQIQRDASAGPSSRSKAFSSSTLSAAHNFSRKGIYMPPQQQQNVPMAGAAVSPRKALAQLDSNAANSRRMMRPVVDSNGVVDVKAGIKAHISQFSAIDMSKMTPINRFSQAYPTPPSGGDPKMSNDFVRQDLMMNGKTLLTGNETSIPLLSPPVSHHNGESSPSYLGADSGLSMAALSKRSSTATSSFSPAISRTDSSLQRSPAVNPFSLDRHKISPSTSASRTSLHETLQPPTSASRLITALDGTNEHKLSPIQARTGRDCALKDQVSPLGKGRKLPSLVKTPLRSIKMEDNRPTPSTAMDLIGNVASIRRLRPASGLMGTDPWKGLMTPNLEEHNDRQLGGTSGVAGFTPFTARSSRYSTTRGLASVSRPSRDNGDQFSSPQHLNLTQSLGLAPHSTGKGAFGSINATPFVHSYLTSNSPWPESVLRPTFKTSAFKRGREDEASRDEESSGAGDDDEDDDDDDDNGGEVFLHETPSRPAKHLRSSLLGSNGNSSAQTNRSTRSRLPSSASREQHPVKPISFNISSDRVERQETEIEAADIAAAGTESDPTTSKSSPPSTSQSALHSEDDLGEEPQSPTTAHAGFSKQLVVS